MTLAKFLTEVTTPEAATTTGARFEADGLDGSALTALLSVSTEDLSALVSLGKSLLAVFTAAVASVWIVVS